MSDETNKPMHDALRKYAERRRQEASPEGDASMPPAMRQALQEEVRKIYPPPSRHGRFPAPTSPGLPPWLLWLVRPSGLGALGAAAALILGVWIVRYDVPSSSTGPEWENGSLGAPLATTPTPAPPSAAEPERSLSLSKPKAEAQAPILADHSSASEEKKSVPPPVATPLFDRKQNQDQERLLRLKDAPASRTRELREQQAQSPPVPAPVAVATAPAPPPVSPSPARPLAAPDSPATPAPLPAAPVVSPRGTQSRLEVAQDALATRAADARNASAASRNASVAPGAAATPNNSMSLRFVQTPAPLASTPSPREDAASTTRAQKSGTRDAGASRPGTSTVMRDFSLKVGQEGSVVILDQDGSQYTGRLVQNAAPKAQQRGNNLGNATGANTYSQDVLLNNYRVTAQGTNRSLRERVVVEGELEISPSLTDAASLNLAGQSGASALRGGVQGGVQNNIQVLTNGQFRGYYQLPNRPPQQINAQQWKE